MRYLFSFLFVIQVFLSRNASSQIELSYSNDGFLFEVKNIDEFIDRFNFDKDILPFKEYGINKDSIQRSMFIRTLFIDELLDSSSTKRTLVDSFIHEACDTNRGIELSFYNTNWIAIGSFKITYQDSIWFSNISLKLVQRNAGYCWVIDDFDKSLQSIVISKKNKEQEFIPPTNNELYFNSLSNIVSNGFSSNLFRFSANYKLIELNKKLSCGDLLIGHCRELKYYFFINSNWIFEVSKIERNETKKSGWLISNIIKSNQNFQSLYYQSILNTSINE